METPDIELLDEPPAADARAMRRMLESRAEALEKFRRHKASLLAAPAESPRRQPAFSPGGREG